jgi:hypothetical protein
MKELLQKQLVASHHSPAPMLACFPQDEQASHQTCEKFLKPLTCAGRD